MSHPEYVTMMFLAAVDNATIIGNNTVGSNGNVTGVPLPGGTTMFFTGLGIFYPDGGQTQRIGLSPDIYVERTIEGIRNGRDEVLDAAVAYLLDRIH